MFIEPPNYPTLLKPVEETTFDISANTVQVRTAKPKFAAWASNLQKPLDTKGNNPLVNVNGKASFGELAILDALTSDGWEGRWIDNYPLPPTFRTRYWTENMVKLPRDQANSPLPRPAQEIYERICIKSGDPRGGGAWDIIAWRENTFLFAEAKKKPSSDRIKTAQLAWLGAALQLGIPLGCFLYIEWTLG